MLPPELEERSHLDWRAEVHCRQNVPWPPLATHPWWRKASQVIGHLWVADVSPRIPSLLSSCSVSATGNVLHEILKAE